MECPRLPAQELYQRYHQGERSFVGVNLSGESLRGMNLRDIDLREADLSYADLRGTHLTNATLMAANLAGVKTGTQWRWVVPKVLAAWVLLACPTCLLAAFSALCAVQLFTPNGSDSLTETASGDIIVGILGLGILVAFPLLTYWKGIIATLGVAASAVAFAGAGTGAVAGISAVSFAVSFAFAFAFTVSVTVAITVAFAVAVAVTVAIAGTVSGAIAIAIAFTVAVAVTAAVAGAGAGAGASAVSFVVTIIILIVTYLTSYRALKGDPRDQLIRNVAVWFASLGGTQFKRANLTDADCSKATLKSAHFNSAILIRTRFYLARKVNLARLDKTILSDFAVQDLMVTLRGRGKSYVGKNLKAANLAGADLIDADFTEADLSQATLEGAELQRVNLTKTQALGTQFRQADLTGACLEAWNIDSTTQLDGTLCDYVYLLKPPQERRPSSGIFQPGEFTKLFEEVLDTIDLIFQNGIDWKVVLKQ